MNTKDLISELRKRAKQIFYLDPFDKNEYTTHDLLHEAAATIERMQHWTKKGICAEIKEKIENKKATKPIPAPRYDEVYFKGVEWLNQLDTEETHPMSQNDNLIKELRQAAKWYKHSDKPMKILVSESTLPDLLSSAASALESNSSFLTIVEESQKYKTLVKALTGDQREEWISPPIFRLRPTDHFACVLEVKHVEDDIPFCDSLDSAIEEWQKRQKDQR